MVGLDPAIHICGDTGKKDMDARDKPARNDDEPIGSPSSFELHTHATAEPSSIGTTHLTARPFALDLALVQPLRQKYFYFFFSELVVLSCRPASHEGRFAIVTNVERGMRWACRVAA
jgi:hypothetical protein